MSASAKVLLVLGIIFLVFIVLCCGGLVLSGVLMGSYFANAVSEDPAVIRQVTKQLAEIDVPEGLKPTASLDMKVPFSGERMMTWVVYADKSSDSTVVLGAMGKMFQQPGQEEQMQLQMEQSLRQQGLQGKQQLAESESSQKEIMVRGKPASFTITKGQGENSKPRIQVVGSFQGSDGRVLLIVSVDAEKYSEDTITKMIESIR